MDIQIYVYLNNKNNLVKISISIILNVIQF